MNIPRSHTAIDDRAASPAEQRAFMARMRETVARAAEALQRAQSSQFQLRVMKVRAHDVRGHRRAEYERTYLSRAAASKKEPPPSKLQVPRKQPPRGRKRVVT